MLFTIQIKSQHPQDDAAGGSSPLLNATVPSLISFLTEGFFSLTYVSATEKNNSSTPRPVLEL
jgi:hypothetical protein